MITLSTISASFTKPASSPRAGLPVDAFGCHRPPSVRPGSFHESSERRGWTRRGELAPKTLPRSPTGPWVRPELTGFVSRYSSPASLDPFQSAALAPPPRPTRRPEGDRPVTPPAGRPDLFNSSTKPISEILNSTLRKLVGVELVDAQEFLETGARYEFG